MSFSEVPQPKKMIGINIQLNSEKIAKFVLTFSLKVDNKYALKTQFKFVM